MDKESCSVTYWLAAIEGCHTKEQREKLAAEIVAAILYWQGKSYTDASGTTSFYYTDLVSENKGKITKEVKE